MFWEGRRSRSMMALATTAAAVVVLGVAGPAQAADITVTAEDGQAPGLYGYRDCDGDFHGEDVLYGTVLLVADTIATVETPVNISYSGSLADDLVNPPATATFEADPDFGDIAFVDFELDALEAGDLTVTVEPGTGYVVGDPASYTMDVTLDEVAFVDCNTDLTEGIGAAADQTIDVGDLPAQLDIYWGDGYVFDGEGTIRVGYAEYDGGSFGYQENGVYLLPEEYTTPVVGSLPPGLDLIRNMWRGGATTPGVSEFGVRLCFDTLGFTTLDLEVDEVGHFGRGRAITVDEVCEGTAQVRITVVGDAAVNPSTTPSPAAPAATPVATDARFTG